MYSKIESEIQLRELISTYPAVLDNRIKDSFDKFSLEFIESAAFVIFSSSSQNIGFKIFSCKDVNIETSPSSKLSINVSRSNFTKLATFKCSLYFLVPGLGHGFRVNGECQISDDCSYMEILVRSSYFHCSRAFVRAKFWDPSYLSVESKGMVNSGLDASCPQDRLDAEKQEFLQQASLFFLHTETPAGGTELSPRGDPQGILRCEDDRTIVFAERPGNKVAISLRNILNNRIVGLLVVIPGQEKFLSVSGTAELSDDSLLLNSLAIKNKIPKLAVIISISSAIFVVGNYDKNCAIWDGNNYVEPGTLTSFPKALSAHINGEGLLGKIKSTVVSSIVKHDLKNLY